MDEKKRVEDYLAQGSKELEAYKEKQEDKIPSLEGESKKEENPETPKKEEKKNEKPLAPEDPPLKSDKKAKKTLIVVSILSFLLIAALVTTITIGAILRNQPSSDDDASYVDPNAGFYDLDGNSLTGGSFVFEAANDGTLRIADIAIPLNSSVISFPSFAEDENGNLLRIDGFSSRDVWSNPNAENIKSLYFPGLYFDIPENFFSDLNISDIHFSNSAREDSFIVQERTFANCLNLVEVDFPYSLKEIKEEAFLNCASLISLDFRDTSLQILSEASFRGCSNLETLILPSTIVDFGDYLFEGTSLASLSYDGTMNEFEKTTRADEWLTGSQIKRVICVDGEIVL